MYSDRSFSITEREYNYLLSSIPKNLFNHEGRYGFVSNDKESIDEILDRLKGLYGVFEAEIPRMLIYNCFLEKSINKFREFIKKENTYENLTTP